MKAKFWLMNPLIILGIMALWGCAPSYEDRDLKPVYPREKSVIEKTQAASRARQDYDDRVNRADKANRDIPGNFRPRFN